MFSYYLGIANMRWGENLNCVSRHTPDSCLLPIRGSGVHADTRGSDAAIRHFGALLESTAPTDEEHVVTLHPELQITGLVTDAETGEPVQEFAIRHGFRIGKVEG